MADDLTSGPNGWPIRIAVRVDFSDGAQHEYDVRADEAVAIPLGAAYWPEGVVTSDMAKRMEHDRKRQEEIETLRGHIDRDHGVMIQLGIIADSAVKMLEHVNMDTDEDRELHARAVGALRGRLSELAAAIKEADEERNG